jgi:hypothetical protein
MFILQFASAAGSISHGSTTPVIDPAMLKRSSKEPVGRDSHPNNQQPNRNRKQDSKRDALDRTIRPRTHCAICWRVKRYLCDPETHDLVRQCIPLGIPQSGSFPKLNLREVRLAPAEVTLPFTYPPKQSRD